METLIPAFIEHPPTAKTEFPLQRTAPKALRQTLRTKEKTRTPPSYLPNPIPPASLQALPSAMPKPHRYTGDFPPIDVLAQYPNWENALDEEGEDGQDETTIRLAEEQNYIAEFIPFTAGDALLASGQQCAAIASIYESIGVAGIHVFNGAEWWELRYDERTQLWQPFTPTWIPEPKLGPTVSLSDASIFPLRFSTRLPFEPGEQPFSITINSDGTEEENLPGST